MQIYVEDKTTGKVTVVDSDGVNIVLVPGPGDLLEIMLASRTGDYLKFPGDMTGEKADEIIEKAEEQL